MGKGELAVKDNLAAGKQKWTKEGVLDAIHGRLEHNLPLNSFAVRQDDEALWQAAKRYCGGWAKALTEAGVGRGAKRAETSHARPGTWSREIIVTKIQAYRDQGSPLGAHQMQKVDNPLVSAAGYYFGSWSRALEAAGVNPDAVRSTVPWTKERVVVLIQDAKKSGADLQDRSIRFWNRALYRAACDHFGTWDNAVKAALREHAPEGRWNPEKIRRLVKDYVAHGFSVKEALGYHPRLARAVVHHYGSIENLMKDLGLPDTALKSSLYRDQAQLLRLWRTERGLSAEEMARHLDIPAHWIEVYENGQIGVPWNIFWRWAALTGNRRDAVKKFLLPARGIKGPRMSASYAPRRILPFSSNSACFVVDAKGTIRHWNPNLAKMTGVEAHQSEGRPCAEVVTTYKTGGNPYCGETCPVKMGTLGDIPQVVHWRHPEGLLIRMHMITDKEGWTTHWIEPLKGEVQDLG